jgi:hypothetical protein
VTNTTSNIFVIARSCEFWEKNIEDVIIYAVNWRIAAVSVTRATSSRLTADEQLCITENTMSIEDARKHWNKYVVDGVWETVAKNERPAWISPIVEAFEK